MRYAFPCNIVRDDEEAEATGREAYVVTFPDVYGANTGAWSWKEALEMAEDCLAVALGGYVKAREDIPTPSPLTDGQVIIAVPLIVAAKLTLYTAMREQDITDADLASQVGDARKRRPKAAQPQSFLPHQPSRARAQGAWSLSDSRRCGRRLTKLPYSF